MGPFLTAAETARIEALLARLGSDQGASCQVQGCVHAHHGRAEPEDEPALAA